MKASAGLQLSILPILIGLGFGITILSIAFDHNPQGEYFDTFTGEYQISNVITLFLPAFLLGALATLIVEILIFWITRHIKK